MRIIFVGNAATRARYECGVKGDGKSETLTFDIAAVQDGFDLTGCEAFLVLAAKGTVYGDKIAIETESTGDRLTADYVIPSTVTEMGALSVQLVFEGAGGEVWQTKLFDIVFAPRAEWSEKIAEGYPSVIVDLQNRITAETERAKSAEAELAEAIEDLDGRSIEIDASLDEGTDTFTIVLNNHKGEKISNTDVILPYAKTADVKVMVDSKIKLVDEIDYNDFGIAENRLLKI